MIKVILNIDFVHELIRQGGSTLHAMNVIILLLIISLFIAGGFLAAFLWSVRDGQFDDDFSPPRRILFDTKQKEKFQ